ncbi:hypothetical protein [Lentzea flaviverrucosa]|uniref:hypothetical protein n=1 Tax=Lentzea flaviverrucosa TaxID=200379 RepID=UPI0011605612|nr:hypothetical protein [Lentzea flaviverrucosa]
MRFAPGAVQVAGEPDPVRPWDAFDRDRVPLTDSGLWWPRRVGIADVVALAARDAPVAAADGPVADLFRGISTR